MKFFYTSAIVLIATLISSASAQNYLIKGPADFSAQCNFTLDSLYNDVNVASCSQIENTLSSAYITFFNDTTTITPFLEKNCNSNSTISTCTSDVITSITTNLNNGCANELANSAQESALNIYAQQLEYAGVYNQILCARDSDSNYCLSDFFTTFKTWPTVYSISAGSRVGFFAAATGDVASNISTQPTSVVCSTCSKMEYSYVFAFVENVLRRSGSISTTVVFPPGPNITTPESNALNGIPTLNTTMSNVCGAPFLSFSYSNVTISTATGTVDQAAATVTYSLTHIGSPDIMVVQSTAAGLHSSISLVALAGIIIIGVVGFY